MKKDFKDFMKCIKEAGRRIDRHYFQLHVFGYEEPIYRERVYCYELYHQLRCVLGDSFSYKLDGELDKAGHEIIQGKKKPDFVVHIPGEMEMNLVVIEVKFVSVKKNELSDDIKKLKKFLEEGKYYKTIMLIYGNGKKDLPQVTVEEAEKLIGNHKDRILLVWHRGHGERPKRIL